jgi:hypothetical protein
MVRIHLSNTSKKLIWGKVFLNCSRARKDWGLMKTH